MLRASGAVSAVLRSPNMAPDQEVNGRTSNPVAPTRALLALEEEERRMEAELARVRERKALERQWMHSVAAQGSLEQQALKMFDPDSAEDDHDAREQKRLDDAGSEGYMTEDFGSEDYGSDEYESEEEEEDEEEEEERCTEGAELEEPQADCRVEDLRQSLGLDDAVSCNQGMRFLCKDGVRVPVFPAFVAAASPKLVTIMVHHAEEALANPAAVIADEIPLHKLSSSGLLYILHCLETQYLEDCRDVHCELSLELCFELLGATSLYRAKKKLDELVLASTFKMGSDMSTLVGFLSSARRYKANTAKLQSRDRVVAYLQKRIRERDADVEAGHVEDHRLGAWSILKQLSWADMERLYFRFHEDSKAPECGPATWTVSAWSLVVHHSKYSCSRRLYNQFRDILIWAAWQVSEEAAQSMDTYLISDTQYCAAYICYDDPDSKPDNDSDSEPDNDTDSQPDNDTSSEPAEDMSLGKSAREQHKASLVEPPPTVLSQLSESGALKAVLRDGGWNWPWGTLETIHPEILLFKVKPLGIIDECRLNKALRWQVPHDTTTQKPLRINRRKRPGMGSPFGLSICRVLQQIHPDFTISLDALAQVNSFVEGMLLTLSREAARIARANKESTISEHTIAKAVRLFLPGELCKHAVSEGIKACQKYRRFSEPEAETS